MKISCEKLNSVSAIVAAVLIPVVVAFIGHGYTKAVKERELQGRFIELAVSILREKPTETNANLRTWATSVIDKYSGLPFTDPAREDLIQRITIPQPQVEFVPRRLDRYAISGFDECLQVLETLINEAKMIAQSDDLDQRLDMCDMLTDFILSSRPDTPEIKKLDEIAKQAAVHLLEQGIEERLMGIIRDARELKALKPKLIEP